MKIIYTNTPGRAAEPNGTEQNGIEEREEVRRGRTDETWGGTRAQLKIIDL